MSNTVKPIKVTIVWNNTVFDTVLATNDPRTYRLEYTPSSSAIRAFLEEAPSCAEDTRKTPRRRSSAERSSVAGDAVGSADDATSEYERCKLVLNY